MFHPSMILPSRSQTSLLRWTLEPLGRSQDGITTVRSSQIHKWWFPEIGGSWDFHGIVHHRPSSYRGTPADGNAVCLGCSIPEAGILTPIEDQIDGVARPPAIHLDCL